MSKLKLHGYEDLQPSGEFDRYAVPGGWLYRIMDTERWIPIQLCFVPDPMAEHVRDRRRLRLRDGWEFNDSSATTSWFETGVGSWENCVVRLFKDARWHVIAWHADKSFTQHATLLEAHVALWQSGSPSPFKVVRSPFDVVTGSAVETPPPAGATP